jgi:hypothetical protein
MGFVTLRLTFLRGLRGLGVLALNIVACGWGFSRKFLGAGFVGAGLLKLFLCCIFIFCFVTPESYFFHLFRDLVCLCLDLCYELGAELVFDLLSALPAAWTAALPTVSDPFFKMVGWIVFFSTAVAVVVVYLGVEPRWVFSALLIQ